MSGTWDWHQLAIELDIPNDAELVWANCLVLAPAVGRVWIDDASFEVVGPTKPAPAAPPAAKKPASSTKH
jgi:hypothetical protein